MAKEVKTVLYVFYGQVESIVGENAYLVLRTRAGKETRRIFNVSKLKTIGADFCEAKIKITAELVGSKIEYIFKKLKETKAERAERKKLEEKIKEFERKWDKPFEFYCTPTKKI
jgi:hypothetical protein